MPGLGAPRNPEELRNLESWKRQEAIFCTAHLVVLASLLLVHTLFATHFGLPSKPLIGILIGAFVIRVVQLVLEQGLTYELREETAVLLTAASVLLNLGVAFAAAVLTDRSDAQYFVLLVMPVIEAAFRFRLPVIVAVVGMSAALNFLWITVYVQRHAAIAPNEYFEAGSISMVYAFFGVLVWMLVTTLRSSEAELAKNLSLLRLAQKKLLQEEKLAAVGRLSSAIAHEVRNPVAMISSSLSTALGGQIDDDDRAQMFEIAAIQASRLEKLTNEFLAYARPPSPVVSLGNVSDVLRYIAELSKARAAERDVRVVSLAPAELLCQFDSSLLQQALLNLVMNAIDASPAQSTVLLRANRSEMLVAIEVENAGQGITPEELEQIFEPFFTTKPGGTGLGLAIARNGVRAMGGELTLYENTLNRVIFKLDLPIQATAFTEAANG